MRTILRISLLLSAFLLVCFVVTVANQTAQLVRLAADFTPAAGPVVLYTLLAIYAVLLLTPLYLYLRLPKQLNPPEAQDSPQFPAFLAALRQRLKRNALLQQTPLDTELEIESAIKLLDAEADKLARKSAASIFLATAISQNGSLDVLFILSAHTRLIWQIAYLYYQRPSPRDFLHLYGNVAATSLVAGEINDIDIEPAIRALFGTGAAALPGARVVASSLTDGAANAFLTLRVAMIAKRYCNCLVRPERRVVRRSATLEAASMVSGAARDGLVQLSKAATAIPKKAMENWWESISSYLSKIGS